MNVLPWPPLKFRSYHEFSAHFEKLSSRKDLKIRSGPSGVHLFSRSTGVNMLIEEVVVPCDLWAKAPLQVSIALTNVCDLTCSHCYAPKNHAVLDFKHLTTWLDELDANGCIGVGFGGGEPTLYPRLVELCSYAAEKTRLAVTMTTHGHHLRDSLIAALSGKVHFIRVSMDGVGNTYESLRGRPFAVLLQRIAALRAVMPFGINYVVNARTLGELDTAVDLARKLGASEFLLLPERSVRGRGGIDQETTKALRRWVATYRAKVPLAVSEAGAEGLPTCNPLQHEVGLRAFAHVDAAGTLKRTSYDAQGVPLYPRGFMAGLHELSPL